MERFKKMAFEFFRGRYGMDDLGKTIFIRFFKLWKVRFENRKDSKIFICKNCGSFIRIPKGKGKIKVTCKMCNDVVIKRS